MEIKWCIDRILLAYREEPLNNTGEENRCEMSWLCSFVAKLLQEMAEILSAKTAEENEDSETARRALSQMSLFVRQAGFKDEDC